MLVSDVQQSNSVIHMCVCVYIYILFHYGLLQDVEYNSACYIVGPGGLFVLHIAVCIC